MRFDELKTPAYVIDEKMLIHNLEILHKVEEDTGWLPHTAGAESIFSICRISADWKIYKRNYGKWNI